MDIQETDLYQQLKVSCRKLYPYYDIDKIKPYSVSVWSKDSIYNGRGENVFDVYVDEIAFYADYSISTNVLSIIGEIQRKLKLLEEKNKEEL